MFQKGQTVVCVDHKMGGIGSILEKGKTYHIEEYVSPEECREIMKDNPAKFHENGGRVEVREYPGCYWYGMRFEAVK